MRADLLAACAPWRLVPPGRSAVGRSGERMGRGPGSSLEFLDFRDYVPGDDLRHVDWRAYARTDALKVRLFREEISPHLDLVVDVSASMGVTPAKAAALADLTDALEHWAAGTGGRVKRFASDGGPLEAGVPLRLDGVGSCPLRPRAPLRPRSVRAVISDFLVPTDPLPELRALAAGAAHLTVIQLLDPWELDPRGEDALWLLDAEDERSRLDLRLDGRALARYRERLGRLSTAVAKAARSVGGTYARVVAAGAAAMFRDDLARQGVLEPA